MSAALDELRQSLKAAQATLRDANTTYEQAEQRLKDAQTQVQSAWDARADAARLVDRHYRAIDAVTVLAVDEAPQVGRTVAEDPFVVWRDEPAPVNASTEPSPVVDQQPGIRHGTEYAYRDKKCRCEICKDGKRQRNAEYKAKAKGKVRAPRIAVKPRPETPIVELDTSNSCAKPEPVQVNGASDPLQRAYATISRTNDALDKIVHTPGVTARCQDCTRAFTLTGRPLDQAIQMHELKHSHIVNVVTETT